MIVLPRTKGPRKAFSYMADAVWASTADKTSSKSKSEAREYTARAKETAIVSC